MIENIYDVLIIGGGPAGLNAAIVLGRCQRRVILFDTGKQRNRMSNGIHNFITRDDILPADFLAIARKEAGKYGVIIITEEIIETGQTGKNLFYAKDHRQRMYTGKKLLIASGLSDIVPEIPGIAALYGKSVFHCPYCDGWEVKNEKIGIYAKNKNGFSLAESLKTWSSKIELYCDGKNYLKPAEKEMLKRLQITVITSKIAALEGREGILKNILFSDGTKRRCDALFFVNGYKQQCSFINNLGCLINKQGVVITNRKQQTNIPGLYVAGDASRDVHFVIVAAAEGAKAGVCINQELQREELAVKAHSLSLS